MKLAIADPPYLGRGAKLYGPDALTFPGAMAPGVKQSGRVGDGHAEADLWDDPETHRQLVARLEREYDGWVIAMNPDNLATYLAWVPDARVCAWVRPNAFPAGHVVRSWEPVLLHRPTRSVDRQCRDYLSAPQRAQGLIGSKPREWTRWVLDMLGYDPDTDTVDDLFGGSGAVAAEIAQGVLL